MIRGKLARQAALPHDQNAIRHLHQLRQLGAHHQDCRAGASEAVHHFEYFHLCANVDAACRFVEQEDLRAARKPLRDDDFLLISAAQSAGKLRPG